MTVADVFAVVPGAVIDDDGVLLHVGNPLGEQRALVGGRALAPRGDRTVLAVDGADRLAWLDTVGTQRLADLTPGVGAETLVLDARGRVQHAASVVDDGTTAWLIVDRARADALCRWLSSHDAGRRVRVRDVRGRLIVVGGTAAAVQAVGAIVAGGVPPVWRDPWPGETPRGARQHPAAGWDWAEALVTPAQARALAGKAQSGAVRLVGALAADALRIAAWRPRADDVDEHTVPREMDWSRIAGPSGACAHPVRRLAALQLDGSESILPARGDVVQAAGQAVGRVRAAAVHYDDGPIALALLDAAAPVDADLVVITDQGPVAAAQEVVVQPEPHDG